MDAEVTGVTLVDAYQALGFPQILLFQDATPLACYKSNNFGVHEPILIIFARRYAANLGYYHKYYFYPVYTLPKSYLFNAHKKHNLF